MIKGLASLAEEHGNVYLAGGLRLCSAKEWVKDAVEDGEPAELSVPFVLADEHEHIAFECVDVSAIIDCLNLLYADYPESKEHGYGAKIIPFPAGGSA